MDNSFVIFLGCSFAFFLMLVLVIIVATIARLWLQKYKRNHEEKKSEAQSCQSYKLEAIGQLAGGVAHDFNNILAGISGAAECLDARLENHKDLQKYTNIIIQSCERASHLTEQLLLFSRQQEEPAEPINLHECLEESLYLLEYGIRKNISIVKDFSANDFIVCVHREHIQSLILNLGFNARDAINGAGEILVKTQNVILDEDVMSNHVIKANSGEYVKIAFRDTGSGISKDVLDKIFNPFFTTKKTGQGTGLGLPAVYGIVREYNGALNVKTSEKGTEFEVYFPVVKKLIYTEKSFQKNLEFKAKVLIVDDEPILLELMKDILESAGSEVVCLKDSQMALQTYQEQGNFDIVMLDVVMPEKTGDEVYNDLKKLNSKVKVVFLSGYHQNNLIEKIVESDSNTCFISKPYHAADVVEKLGILLAKA